MSFTFYGAGPKADVIHQIRSHHAHDDQEMAVAVRNLIQAALEHDSSSQWEDGSGFVYLVKASGHASPGSAAQLELSITPFWVPSVREPVAAAIDPHDLGFPDSPVMGADSSDL
jgi:hypothetical protein